MNLQKFIFPVFVGSNLIGQTTSDLFPNLNFGFTHSVYASTCLKSMSSTSILNKELHHSKRNSKISETQYGFGIGLFLWMPLNEGVVFKPKIEGSFSNTCLKNGSCIFATSFDLNISHNFVIALNEPDKEGIIYCARNMSCYLTSKQPYLLIGPKINLKKFDKGYIHKGFENELAFGFIIGYGINYVFHGKNVAPEICYTISSTSQNKINNSKKMTHTISLAINLF